MKKDERIQLLNDIISGIQNVRLPLGGTVSELHTFTTGIGNVCAALAQLKESIAKDEEPKVENGG